MTIFEQNTFNIKYLNHMKQEILDRIQALGGDIS